MDYQTLISSIKDRRKKIDDLASKIETLNSERDTLLAPHLTEKSGYETQLSEHLKTMNFAQRRLPWLVKGYNKITGNTDEKIKARTELEKKISGKESEISAITTDYRSKTSPLDNQRATELSSVARSIDSYVISELSSDPKYVESRQKKVVAKDALESLEPYLKKVNSASRLTDQIIKDLSETWSNDFTMRQNYYDLYTQLEWLDHEKPVVEQRAKKYGITLDLPDNLLLPLLPIIGRDKDGRFRPFENQQAGNAPASGEPDDLKSILKKFYFVQVKQHLNYLYKPVRSATEEIRSDLKGFEAYIADSERPIREKIKLDSEA